MTEAHVVRVLIVEALAGWADFLARQISKEYLGKLDKEGTRYQVNSTMATTAAGAFKAFRESAWDFVILGSLPDRELVLCDLMYYSWSIGVIRDCGPYADTDRLRAGGYYVEVYCPF